MGVVYRAWDTTLERDVALKELLFPGNMNADVRQEMVERFMREARSAARLAHPNVVQVYDVFSVDDRYFIAMELLDGEPLGDLIARGRMSVPAATNVVLQILDALGAAHAAGVVHRDVKPDNIYVLADGRVKVTDFGIARVMDSAQSAQMTQIGTVMGTPGYMAPEQVMGVPADARADLFAVGVVAFELLSAANPFLSSSSTATLYRIVNEQPPSLAAVGVPAGLDAVVQRALAKDPGMRYQSAADMAFDIRSGSPSVQGYSPQLQTPAQAPGASGIRPAWIVAGAVAVVAVVVVAIFSSGSAPRVMGTRVGIATSTVIKTDPPVTTTEPVVPPVAPPVTPPTGPAPGSLQTPFWAGFYFASKDQATSEAEAAQLRSQGFSAVVLYTPNYTTIGTPGKPMWVVGAGPYQTKAEAAAACDQLRGLGKPSPYPKQVQ